MRALLAVLMIAGSTSAATAADTVAGCQTRHAELSKQVPGFQGEPMTKRVIQADLDRATREMVEGDADECMEALDHATKLLKGEF